MVHRKKLIEVSLPLEAINAASAREKSIRHGHPSTLHLWWARRPLAACRAVLFAQLVDDPSSWPDRFPTEVAQEAERKRLHDLIARMVKWEASNNEAIFNEARFEIAKSIAWGAGEEPPPADKPATVLGYLQTKAPPVYDPFCGGGSIPLEAQRLGLRAYGSDLNPVAVLISKALVEIPPKFAGLPPINPEARDKLARGGFWSGHGAEGLAEDVRYYGGRMRDEAEKRVGHLYPRVTVPDGTEANVIAWLWARTVRSPDPAAKGAMVPLVSSFMLSTKGEGKAWAEVVIDASSSDGWRFEVRNGALSKPEEAALKLGTKSGKGQAFLCALTRTPIERTYIQAEGKARRLGARLMAIVVEGDRRRTYVSPDTGSEDVARTADAMPIVSEARATFLSGATPTRAMITGGVCSAYGLATWGDLFTSRQIAFLVTCADLIQTLRLEVEHDFIACGGTAHTSITHETAARDHFYGDSIATFLALALGKVANIGSSLAGWMSDRGAFRETFARQALPMVWDYAEANPFAKAGGSFDNAIERGVAALASAPACGLAAVDQLDAAAMKYVDAPLVINTDPPYYDNIGYADLSDFFYVWLRRSLHGIWPDLFRRLLTPKKEELVATPFHHGGKAQADRFFIEQMSKALIAMHNASAFEVPLAIYYAFKQSEAAEGGTSSPGWAAFLQAIVDADLLVDGTWPLRTESAGRIVGQGTNALASSIMLVCRRRDRTTITATRTEFLRALRRELPASLVKIREAGIQAVDFQQAAIGPGMGVFSRYAKVMEADDSGMTVRTALMLINSLIEELASEQDATYDPDTQAALVWFQSFGWSEQPSGHAITLATSKNTALDTLFRSGAFIDLRGRVRLTKRTEMPHDRNPASDRHFTLWEAAQHLARALDAEEGGIDAAARIFAGLGPRASDVLPLVYRLYQIAGEQRKDAAEANVWNRLESEWPTIERRAAEIAETPASAAPTLFDQGAA